MSMEYWWKDTDSVWRTPCSAVMLSSTVLMQTDLRSKPCHHVDRSRRRSSASLVLLFLNSYKRNCVVFSVAVHGKYWPNGGEENWSWNFQIGAIYLPSSAVPLIKIGTFNDAAFSSLRNFYGYKQGCTNPHSQVTRKTKFSTVAPNVCESSEESWLHITLLCA